MAAVRSIQQLDRKVFETRLKQLRICVVNMTKATLMYPMTKPTFSLVNNVVKSIKHFGLRWQENRLGSS